jgi:8-oxo-dGTP pyrophosphatase MutT (NUDIX family)
LTLQELPWRQYDSIMTLKARLAGKLLPLSPVEIPQGIDQVAAVLILIGHHKDSRREEILMTKRTISVETHKGQIAFPGGYREEKDVDLLATALRESQEEVGLDPAWVEVVGRLHPLHTHLKEILVYPYVGITEFPLDLVLSPKEVEKLLYVPLEKLLVEGLTPMEVPVGPAKIKSIGMVVDRELIWGASARMLAELREVLR